MRSCSCQFCSTGHPVRHHNTLRRGFQRKKNPIRRHHQRQRGRGDYGYRRNAGMGARTLTPELLETLRIVPQQSPEGVQFQAFMEKLIVRLFPKIDLQEQPIDFVIIDEKEVNAFCGTSFYPTLVGFTRGLLNKVKYIEDIAGILGHEFTHKRFAVAYGIQHLNTKLEELAADLWPLVLIYDAGLDPRQYVSYANSTVFKQETKWSWADIFDVHPMSDNRARSLEDSLAILDKARGGFRNLSPTALPVEFFEMVKTAHHISFIDYYLANEGYAAVGVPKKLEIIGELFDHIFSANHEVNAKRIKDLYKELRVLKVKRSETAAHDALADVFFDVFVKDGDSNWVSRYRRIEVSTYQAICKLNYAGAKALGRLRLYQECIDQFIEAKNFKTAFEAASHCLAAAKADPLFIKRPDFTSDTGLFSNFEMPYKSTQAVSWNKHLHWTEGNPAAKDVIYEMLLALGIIDHRIFDVCSSSLELAFQKNSLFKFLNPMLVEDFVNKNNEDEDEDYDYDDDEDEDEESGEMLSFDISRAEIDEDGFIFNILAFDPATKELTEEEEVDNSEEFHKEVRAMSKRFLEITPGDKPNEEALLGQARDVFGSERKSPVGTLLGKEIGRAWVALDHAEHNFPLFMELNTHIWASIGGDLQAQGGEEDEVDALIYIKRLVNKLTELAESKNKTNISIVRHLFLGRDRNSLAGVYAEGFLLPIYEHPPQYLMEFAIDNPGNIFTRREQLHILHEKSGLEATKDYFDLNRLCNESLLHFREFLGYNKPINGKDYLALQQKLAPRSTSRKKYLEDNFANTVLTIELEILVHVFYRDREKEKNTKHVLLPAQLETFLSLVDAMEIKNRKDLQVYLRPLIARKKWPTDLGVLLDQWITIYTADIFPDDQILCFSLLRQILRDIKQIKDPVVQQGLYEKFLYNYRLADPTIRDRIHKYWVTTIYKQYKKDTGKSDYAKKINVILRQMKTGIAFAGDRIEVAALLADKLETQVPLTRQFFNMLKALKKDDLHKTQLRGMMIESAIMTLKRNPTGRRALINYLINPLSNASVDALYTTMKTETKEAEEVTLDMGTATARTIKIPPDRAKAEIRFLWENFWATPFLVRAALFEYLLFPEMDPGDEARKGIFNFVNKHLFPQEEKYSDEARKFVEAYFVVTPEYQHRIMLSAMMVTAEKSHEAHLGIGERLAAVLELLGPAETKLGQVIHSHPQTPDEIRGGMGKLKSRADPPYRWNLFNNYQESVPEEIRSRVLQIGKLLGSASFFLAFEAKIQAGQKKLQGVFKILRPNALKRARNGFDIMMEMLEHLDLGASTIQVLEQMISQAKNNAEIETNHIIGAQQTEFAIQMYDGRRVLLDGEEFRLHVPKTILFGETYQFVELAPGNHFNDLPDKTPSQRDYKRKLALVYFFYELNLILRGGRFDSDRHGAQLRIKGNDIYLFDWGNMLLQPPTDEDLAELGQAIVATFINIMSGKSINDALSSTIQSKTDANEDVSYLIEVQKALLSLEDFRHYVSQDELIAMLGIILQGKVHPAIVGAILGQAGQMGLDITGLQQFMGETPAMQLEIIEPATPPKPSRARRFG